MTDPEIAYNLQSGDIIRQDNTLEYFRVLSDRHNWQHFWVYKAQCLSEANMPINLLDIVSVANVFTVVSRAARLRVNEGW